MLAFLEYINEFYANIRKKKKAPNKDYLDAESENLAVPEVHVGDGHAKHKVEKEKKDIEYENLAIPEVHPRKKKK